MKALIALALAAIPLVAADAYLFTSFRRNGETGVFFALSRDGRQWTPLNNNQPWIKPEHAGMLMRDPFLTQGPDGTWHLLWTWGWTRREMGGGLKIGYTSSRDLVTWTPQRQIPVFEDEPTARNAWAPEAAWDAKRKEWIIFWSTTIPGRFPDTEATGDAGYNHRLYAMTTRDWKTFSPPRLWFDPGFNCIDATLVHDGGRWIMVFKDERKNPLQKRLRLAFADSPAGPWTGITEPFTKDWVEGPSALRINGEWWIYFDHYTNPRHYGAIRTNDWKTFEDATAEVKFPADHRHGTVVRIPEKLARRVESASRP
ncbi:MAG TPA: glycoside hydrolase family 43 protein [Bryobacteraceae bacterium]|nr:glycoside hydrolase family 43 protein [Bryobacteraceae bacterium]